MRLDKNNQNIPAPEPDSISDSSSPEVGSIPSKLGKIKLKSIVNQQYIKGKIKKLP